ncbi:MAG TPA: glycoside hydrolase family 43 protein [Verrucomicrobiae bacterium]
MSNQSILKIRSLTKGIGASTVMVWRVLLLLQFCLPIALLGAREFRPGDYWLDTSGHFINAHGGGILFKDGVYYWYGEFKEGATYVTAANKSWGGTRVVNGGFSCYASTNLVDWKFEGLALAPVPDNPASDLHCEKVMERPKVIYNAKTKKFVLWFHQDEPDYSAARSGVAVSETPSGPFKYLGSFRPDAGVWPINATELDKTPAAINKLAADFAGGQMARDMTVFVDDDGTAYQFYSSEGNPTMHVSQLSDDYLKPAGKYARIFVGRSMEAPAVFKHDGKYFLIASGCTGWAPNAARSAVATNIFGPWTELGNPCRGADAATTFGGQSTFVLPVSGQPNTYIAMFDRWKQWDLKDSRYLWLPVRFEDGAFVVEWRDRWRLDEGRGL